MAIFSQDWRKKYPGADLYNNFSDMGTQNWFTPIPPSGATNIYGNAYKFPIDVCMSGKSLYVVYNYSYFLGGKLYNAVVEYEKEQYSYTFVKKTFMQINWDNYREKGEYPFMCKGSIYASEDDIFDDYQAKDFMLNYELAALPYAITAIGLAIGVVLWKLLRR